jgi:uncharacterized phage protein (TIGR02218 family)
MKTLPGALATAYQQPATRLTVLVKLTRRDGAVYGFTSHDKPLRYNGLLYLSGTTAPALSTMQRSTGFEPSNADVDGVFNDSVTASDVEAELWSGAIVDVYRADWSDISKGAELLAHGELGEITHDGRAYKVEMMGRAHKLGRVITRAYLPTCHWDLGDSRCGVDIEALAVNGTVSAVTDNRNFEANDILSASQYHTYGRITWLTGENEGREMEVKEQLVGGDFELLIGMRREIALGDTLRAYPGCNKLLKTGVAEYLGDCKVKFNNVVNFGGFPEIPGIDKILRPAGT